MYLNFVRAERESVRGVRCTLLSASSLLVATPVWKARGRNMSDDCTAIMIFFPLHLLQLPVLPNQLESIHQDMHVWQRKARSEHIIVGGRDRAYPGVPQILKRARVAEHFHFGRYAPRHQADSSLIPGLGFGLELVTNATGGLMLTCSCRSTASHRPDARNLSCARPDALFLSRIIVNGLGLSKLVHAVADWVAALALP